MKWWNMSAYTDTGSSTHRWPGDHNGTPTAPAPARTRMRVRPHQRVSSMLPSGVMRGVDGHVPPCDPKTGVSEW